MVIQKGRKIGDRQGIEIFHRGAMDDVIGDSSLDAVDEAAFSLADKDLIEIVLDILRHHARMDAAHHGMVGHACSFPDCTILGGDLFAANDGRSEAAQAEDIGIGHFVGHDVPLHDVFIEHYGIMAGLPGIGGKVNRPEQRDGHEFGKNIRRRPGRLDYNNFFLFHKEVLNF